METTKATVPTQILQFQLGGENFAFDVLKTREVLTIVKVTPLPSGMDFLSGVINLRGSIIPVVDLRKKFGIATVEDTIDTSIIIVEIQSSGETTVVGAIVDAVKGVLICDPGELEPPPKYGMRFKSTLVQAIAKRADQFIVILDTNQVFSESELDQILEQVAPN